MTTNTNRLTCLGIIVGCVFLIPLSGCSKTEGTSMTPAATSIGTKFDDSVITTQVSAALMSNESIKSLDIKVKVRKGEVMLSGFAANQDQIDLSIAIAKGVEGVTTIDNQLSLKEGKQSVGNKIDDSVITARVKGVILADQSLKSLDISVTTRKGEVMLSGFVDNSALQTRAMEITQKVDGVSSVVNHMSIKK